MTYFHRFGFLNVRRKEYLDDFMCRQRGIWQRVIVYGRMAKASRIARSSFASECNEGNCYVRKIQ